MLIYEMNASLHGPLDPPPPNILETLEALVYIKFLEDCEMYGNYIWEFLLCRGLL